MDRLERYLNDQTGSLIENQDLLRREIAYERLKDALQHADLEAGDVLSENRLSKALGISRTPVREALQQLAQEGMVFERVHVTAPSCAPSRGSIFYNKFSSPLNFLTISPKLQGDLPGTPQIDRRFF